MVGVAPYPAARRGEPGHTLVNSIGSFVLNARTQDAPNQQEKACTLLMKMFTSEVTALHTQKARLLSSLSNRFGNSAMPGDEFTKATEYLWDYPGYPHNMDQFFIHDRHILYQYLVRVEAGELSPEMAASLAVRTLQSQLGDEIEIQ